MYETFINKHIKKGSTIYIADNPVVYWYIESLISKYKDKFNIHYISLNENDVISFKKNLMRDDMPKFDFIIQNPPYSKSLHLEFFKAGYNLLSDTGKMVIIEPATWLINIRNNGKSKVYDEIKSLAGSHIKRIIIDNYNKEFNITNTVPFSITYIDKENTYDNIEYIIFGNKNNTTNIYDINLIGNKDLLTSIFKKIKKCDKVNKHLTNHQNSDNTKYYLLYNEIVRPLASSYFIRTNYFEGDNCYFVHAYGNYYMSYISPLMNISRNDISNIIPKSAARGGSTPGKVKLTDKPGTCIVGTKNELEHWKYYVCNNSLPLFINICMTIDQNNNSLEYVPWLVDKKYTDQEIYDKFGFTDEEIKLIETTIKKYERNSPWFKRYMCGPSLVEDEEVQKFIDKINA